MLFLVDTGEHQLHHALISPTVRLNPPLLLFLTTILDRQAHRVALVAMGFLCEHCGVPCFLKGRRCPAGAGASPVDKLPKLRETRPSSSGHNERGNGRLKTSPLIGRLHLTASCLLYGNGGNSRFLELVVTSPTGVMSLLVRIARLDLCGWRFEGCRSGQGIYCRLQSRSLLL